MKKLLIGIALLLCFGLDGFCTETGSGDSTETFIRIGVIGGRPRPRPRGEMTAPIEIFVYRDSGTLSVLFAESFGMVDISVEDSMGTVVAETQCDTTEESGAVLYVPTEEDTYTLSIVGSEIDVTVYYEL